jgi:hypothetical protein
MGSTNRLITRPWELCQERSPSVGSSIRQVLVVALLRSRTPADYRYTSGLVSRELYVTPSVLIMLMFALGSSKYAKGVACGVSVAHSMPGLYLVA